MCICITKFENIIRLVKDIKLSVESYGILLLSVKMLRENYYCRLNHGVYAGTSSYIQVLRGPHKGGMYCGHLAHKRPKAHKGEDLKWGSAVYSRQCH